MAHLTPYPFALLLARAVHEYEALGRIFDLPRGHFFRPPADRNYSVRFHGRRAETPFGPAAGPHSQMAQNIVLAWLSGARIIELKTVQVLDRLQIPRPCIDVATIGFNVEWSQELSLPESLEEYVKASMLIDALARLPGLDVGPGAEDVVFDMSVGYDLAGIQSEAVGRFISGMLDASAIVDRLRRTIPSSLERYAHLPFRTRISDTVTLSTFHGCPPNEIERIALYMMEHWNLDCVVKLNPTLLGPSRVRELLHDRLGYHEISVPEEAFQKDTQWNEAVDFIGRLNDRARAIGRRFGIKLTNTLVVKNHRSFFPADQKEMYLSGAPLHVLAMELVRRFRRVFRDELPISFSAGIDKFNFPDAVALGLVPVTVCTDLLRAGGYGRARRYFSELDRRMAGVGARTVEEWILKAYAQSDGDGTTHSFGPEPIGTASDGPPAVAAAILSNTERYVSGLASEERYGAEANRKPPKKIGRTLAFFDCITCDKCIPVCPNDANFSFPFPATTFSRSIMVRSQDGWRLKPSAGPAIAAKAKHQIGNFADFCNECGNCDVFCPEDGGPYIVKPRFFSDRQSYDRHADLPGFYFGRNNGETEILGRFPSGDYVLIPGSDQWRYDGPGFHSEFDPRDPENTFRCDADSEVDLTFAFIMWALYEHVVLGDGINYVSTIHRFAGSS